MFSRNVLDRAAVWTAEYVVICEWVSPAPRGEFERRYRYQAKHQGPDNSVFAHAKSPTNVDIEHAYRIPDKEWETGLGDDAQVGLS